MSNETPDVTVSEPELPDIDPAVSSPTGWTGLRRSRRLRKLIIQSLQLGTFYVIVIIYFSIRSPEFFSYNNAINILSGAAVIGIVSIGQGFAIISGGFDLSVGGAVPIGAVVYALTTNNNWPIAAAIAASVAAGCVLGVVNGFIIVNLQINPLITTLGTLSIATGIAFTLTNGITDPLVHPDAGFLDDTLGQIPYYVLVLLGLAIVAHIVLRHTTYGRMIYAIGGSKEASRLAGIRVNFVSMSIYIMSAGLSAFAGVVVANQLLAGSPTVGSSATLESVAAVILGGAALTGGVGGMPGTMIGVLLLATVANGLALLAVAPFYQQIVTGVVLLIAVGFGRLRLSIRE
jgi:ribose transport system permease protein